MKLAFTSDADGVYSAVRYGRHGKCLVPLSTFVAICYVGLSIASLTVRVFFSGEENSSNDEQDLFEETNTVQEQPEINEYVESKNAARMLQSKSADDHFEMMIFIPAGILGILYLVTISTLKGAFTSHRSEE